MRFRGETEEGVGREKARRPEDVNMEGSEELSSEGSSSLVVVAVVLIPRAGRGLRTFVDGRFTPSLPPLFACRGDL